MSVRQIFLLLVALFALSFSLYGNSLPNSFQLDDTSSITANPSVVRGDIAAAIAFWPGRALVYASFAVHSRLFGLEASGLRVFNILGHAVAAMALAWLLYGLLRITVPARDPRAAALLAALFFLAHPLQSQAVGYVVQRAAAWAGMFSLLSLASYTQALRAGRARAWLMLAGLCAILAMLCKESAIVLPVLIFLLDLLCARAPGRFKRILPFALMLSIVPAIAALGGSFGEFGSDSLLAEHDEVGRVSYALTQLEVMARYGLLTLLPLGQNVDHHIPWKEGLDGGRTILWFLPHLLAFLAALWLWKRKHPIGAFCILAAYASLAPESSIFPIHDAMFEHRAYLALAFAAILFGLAASWLARRRLLTGWVTAVVLLSALGVLTVQRNRVWRTQESLWSDAVRKSPLKGRPHVGLGIAYARQARFAEAREQLDLGLRYAPLSEKAWTNLGNVHLAQNELDEAVYCFEYILARKPTHASAWYNLGVAHDRARRLTEAREAYSRALALRPEDVLALNAIAAIELKMGEVDSARRHAQEAARLGSPAAKLLEAIRARS